MLKVIGLTGKKQNGKSTTYNYIKNHVDEEQGTIVMRYSMAAPLKAICHILFGGTAEHWYGDLKEEVLKDWNKTPRQLLQTVGTDMFRKTFGGDFWCEAARVHINRVMEFESKQESPKNICVIIDDIRFDEEARMIKEFGGRNYYITRLGIDNDSDHHISENGIDISLVSAQMIASNLEELETNARFIATENGLCLHKTP